MKLERLQIVISRWRGTKKIGKARSISLKNTMPFNLKKVELAILAGLERGELDGS